MRLTASLLQPTVLFLSATVLFLSATVLFLSATVLFLTITVPYVMAMYSCNAEANLNALAEFSGNGSIRGPSGSSVTGIVPTGSCIPSQRADKGTATDEYQLLIMCWRVPELSTYQWQLLVADLACVYMGRDLSMC